jgi:hypothetical protein
LIELAICFSGNIFLAGETCGDRKRAARLFFLRLLKLFGGWASNCVWLVLTVLYNGDSLLA